MAHQQKLVHVQNLTSVAEDGNQAVVTGFQIDDVADTDAYAVAPHILTCETQAADPGEDSRWWTTARTTAGFTFNWAGYNEGVCNLRIVARIYHSICFDVSSEQPPY